jgi:hypothetical protein
MLPTQLIKEIIFSGVRFQYESYDYKKAMVEVEALNATQQPSPYNNFRMMGIHGIPNEIKKNHIVWRTGKLWEVKFNHTGNISGLKIGRYYGYFKTFDITDFGIKFKPRLFKSEDKYDLIKQGLAVEETI